MKKGSRGSGERCITHRKCSREPLLSADQLRVARLSQPEQNDTHGSRASRQLQAICSTGRARTPAISRRACRVPFTCRVAPAKPRPGVVARRYGVAPSRIQRGKVRPGVGGAVSRSVHPQRESTPVPSPCIAVYWWCSRRRQLRLAVPAHV